MTDEELQTIENFTRAEIEKTGATVESVQYALFQKLDTFRDLVGKEVSLIENGLTTGSHKSDEHPQGLAADVFIKGKIDPYYIFKKALDAGFNRIGIYWNGKVFTFHLAIGAQHGFWTATKTKPGEPWTYGSITVDPRKSR